MAKYSIVHPWLLSFFSTSLYRDVARHWGGIGLLYMLLLLTIAWAATLAKMQWGLNGFIANEAPKLLDQIPPIQFKDGEATVDAKMPYTITNPEDGTPLIVLDTTGEINSLDQTDAQMLLTNDKLYNRRDTGIVQTTDLAQFGDFEFNKDVAADWVGYTRWLWLILFPFVLVFSVGYRLLQMLIFAVVGLVDALCIGANLSFAALMRLSAIALTPSIILDTVLGLLAPSIHIPRPVWWLICISVTVIYVIIAVHANAGPSADDSLDKPDETYPEWARS